jgi:hypothetical protein
LLQPKELLLSITSGLEKLRQVLLELKEKQNEKNNFFNQ